LLFISVTGVLGTPLEILLLVQVTWLESSDASTPLSFSLLKQGYKQLFRVARTGASGSVFANPIEVWVSLVPINPTNCDGTLRPVN
jgi:hypothetical protein